MFNFILYKIAAFIVQALPQNKAYRLGELLADLHLFFSAKDRRALINNLKIILPGGADVNNKAREVSRNFARYLADFLRFPLINQNYIRENIKLENLHFIDESLTKGKGVILVSAHIGSWELGGIALGLLGYDVAGVVLTHKHKLVDNFFRRQREIKGLKAIRLAEAPRKCLEYLRGNKIVILMVDRDFTQNGLILDFLGKKAMLPRGAAVFSLKTGAPIIPTFITRNVDNTFTLHFDRPIEPGAIGDKQSDVESLMKKYLPFIEANIKKFPEQWLMFREFYINNK